MTLAIIILIWILCGVLAFRLECRRMEEYEYNPGDFDGFFILVIFGGFSLVLCIVITIIEKIEDLEISYNIRKKLYEIIVGKESDKKIERKNKDMKYCSSCVNWQYNEHIEQKYGMGSGVCERDNEVKGCDRKACLLYEEKEKQ